MSGLRQRLRSVGRATLAYGVLTLCVAVIPAVAARAATWTYTPELVRLDADGNELPAGEVDVERVNPILGEEPSYGILLNARGRI